MAWIVLPCHSGSPGFETCLRKRHFCCRNHSNLGTGFRPQCICDCSSVGPHRFGNPDDAESCLSRVYRVRAWRLDGGGDCQQLRIFTAMWSFILPTALPVIFIFSARHDISHIELAVMMVMFALVLIASGRNINRSIAENFRLRIEQDMLSKQLSASETAMREAQEIAQVGSWEIDLVQKSYFCSSEALRVFGFDPEKDRPSLDTMLARVHPEDRWMVDKHISEAMASERGRGIDHRLVMDDGTTKYVHELAESHVTLRGVRCE